MRNLRKHVLGLGGLALFVMLSAMALLPPGKNGWLRVSGAVIPNASRTHTYTDKPIRMLSVEGQRWATWDKMENASAYHALVLLSSVPVSNSGYLSENDGYSHRSVERWLMQGDEEREIEIAYDAIWQTVTVGARTYSLRDGNLFVIRFDANREPQVTQLSTTINRGATAEGLEKLINVFKSALPEDKTVQQL
jgi:hypothetical protein